MDDEYRELTDEDLMNGAGYCDSCDLDWEVIDQCGGCFLCEECCVCKPDPDLMPGGADDLEGNKIEPTENPLHVKGFNE